MSVINKLIADIKRDIPKPVLEVAFLKRKGRNTIHAGGLDWEIRNKVIDGWLAQDLNFLGAETINVPLKDSSIEFLESADYRTVIRVPKKLTKGRWIAQVLSFNYYYNAISADTNNGWSASSYNISGQGNSPLMNISTQVMRAASPAPIASSSNVETIGENVVVISDYMGRIQTGSLTVRLGQDSELSNWDNAAVFMLGRWAIMAAKAWVWANTVVDLDSGYLYGGAELSRISSIIDGYSDANENYMDYREEVIEAVNFMMDGARYQTHLRGGIAGMAR